MPWEEDPLSSNFIQSILCEINTCDILMCRPSAPGPKVDFSSVFLADMICGRGPDVEIERLVVPTKHGARKARCMGSALAESESMRPDATEAGNACMSETTGMK